MKSLIIIQVFIAFFAGLTALFLMYKSMNYFMKKKFEIEEANSAFAVLQVGILFATSFIMSSVLTAAINAVQFLNTGSSFQLNSVLTSITYIVIFTIIGMLFTFAVIFSSVFIFFQLTHINEWEQIKLNNIPTSLISAALILGLALIMDDYIGHLCEALIPYPETIQIR
ncbi:MAG: hypothetical protein RLZZ546_3323 [Bacteroidota bacterium]|jgi:uncharacterized membrane protein YjfL (UPF0719 family)